MQPQIVAYLSKIFYSA